jgi:hypothetical protein
LKKQLLIVTTLLILVAAAASLIGKETPAKQSTLAQEYYQSLLKMHSRDIDTTAIFLTSSRCRGCHGPDPQHLANVTLDGVDINLFDDWQTSMMGLAGVDPLWKAKVRQEVLTNPAHAIELQNLCTDCHAPMGHFSAFYKGADHYTLEDLADDSLGLSGVGCLGCHAIGQTGLGGRFTGDIPYDTNRVAYGPFIMPFTGPMQLYVNFTPTYSDHVSQGKFCSPCHTLISHTVDLDGIPTGTSFVEQATYHEWVNSSYPAMGKTCQTCHMPQVEDPVKIAVGYTALLGRSPFNQHSFAGANSFMVDLIRRNKAALNIIASEANFDSTLAATNRNLRYNTLDAELSDPDFFNDSVGFELMLTNKSGHKFPSGYPSRRAIVVFTLTADNGDTLFSSGNFDSSGEIVNYGGVVEPHHDVITSENQVQIYEMNMGDVNGDFTTILERANVHLKDNRIPPLGFTNQHASYDTMRVVGAADTDPDFNKAGSTQGTGRDIVHYRIALNGYTGTFKATAKVYYQAVPPAWLTEMRTLDAPEINSFLSMYDEAPNIPALVAGDSLSELINPLLIQSLKIKAPVFFPNPAKISSGLTMQFQLKPEKIRVYSLSGQEMPLSWKKNSDGTWHINLTAAAGTYLVSVEVAGKRFTQRILLVPD